MKAVSDSVTIAQLPKNHPAKDWEGLWERLSLLTLTGPIILDLEKILMSAGRQIGSAIELHTMTHGSGPCMIETLGNYTF